MNDDKINKTRNVLKQALAQSDPEQVKDRIEEALCILDNEDYEEFKQFKADAKNLSYQRGYRDGRQGLSPSSTSTDYWRGWQEGRKAKAIEGLQRGEL